MDFDYLFVLCVYIYILSFLSSLHYTEAVVELICVRAHNSSCKFTCGQDVLNLSAIDGSSVQPRYLYFQFFLYLSIWMPYSNNIMAIMYCYVRKITYMCWI